MRGATAFRPGSPAGIYLAGRRGAGKSTAAEILRREVGARVVRITDPLYEVARGYFGMEEKDRLLLQRIGDGFRAVDPAWLAKHAAWRLSEATGAGLAVIEGVRTREEAEWLNRNGWAGLLLVAPEHERLARRAGEPSEADEHHTEREVDTLPVAAVVPNTGSLETLTRRLLAAVTALQQGRPCAGSRTRRYHWHVLEGPANRLELAGCFRALRHAEAAILHRVNRADQPWWGNPRDGYVLLDGHVSWYLELHLVPAAECRVQVA